MPPSFDPRRDTVDDELESDLVALFSALSHDLRAALNGISVWTHILERNADETTSRAIDGIRRAVGQQSQLAAELSDFGRALAAEGWSSDMPSVDVLHEVVEAARAVRAPAAIHLRLPSSLPAVATAAGSLRVLIQLLLADLLLHGGEGASITVSAQATSDAVTLHFGLSDAGGTPLPARPAGSRRSLRETLAALAARFGGVVLAPDGDDLVLRMPTG
jgi:signal transduction histidine kinase